MRDWMRRYYASRRDELRPRLNAYRREWTKRWRTENLDKVRAKGRRDQADRRFGRDLVTLAYVEILRRDPCSYCGGPAGVIDHIEPLRTGGKSGWENLTAACGACNAAKRDHPLLFFLGIRAGFWPAVRPGHWGAYQAARAEVEAGRVDKRLASHD